MPPVGVAVHTIVEPAGCGADMFVVSATLDTGVDVDVASVIGNARSADASAASAGLDSARYLLRFTGYVAPHAPDVLRADLQMPRRRIWHELRGTVGLQGQEWQMRSPAASRRAEERKR